MKTSRSVVLFLTCYAWLGIVGCAEEEPIPEPVIPAVEFGSGIAIIESAADTFTMGVDVAESATQRARGLMQRPSLDPDSGMIFLFPEEQGPDGSFYMYNTLIPLSIAFIDGEGRIGGIQKMEPCTYDYPQWCRYYEAGVPFHSALEANSGYFEARGIEMGDRVTFSRD